DTKHKRDIAIKFLPSHVAAANEDRERFRIEAQAAAALNHPICHYPCHRGNGWPNLFSHGIH
ncbi:MAG: hypothetical protein KAR20_14160, partial [Candidatus Heimdallarchaeota archaeon]|nr:hypothetical protein [Candidatus Heimdallarchaeota archaeon]